MNKVLKCSFYDDYNNKFTQLKLGNTTNPNALVLWSQVNRFLGMLPFLWDNSLTVHLKMLLMNQYVKSFSVKF